MNQEIERLQAEIDRWSNWLIQGRAGDHGYLRTYVQQCIKKRDALLAGEEPPKGDAVRGVRNDSMGGF